MLIMTGSLFLKVRKFFQCSPHITEDIEIAPDFFEYFIHTSPLLDIDSSIYCISAWNDNGKAGLVNDPSMSLFTRLN